MTSRSPELNAASIWTGSRPKSTKTAPSNRTARVPDSTSSTVGPGATLNGCPTPGGTVSRTTWRMTGPFDSDTGKTSTTEVGDDAGGSPGPRIGGEVGSGV